MVGPEVACLSTSESVPHGKQAVKTCASCMDGNNREVPPATNDVDETGGRRTGCGRRDRLSIIGSIGRI